MTATVRFTEEMLGHVTFGESDFDRGAEPTRDGVEAILQRGAFVRGEDSRVAKPKCPRL